MDSTRIRLYPLEADHGFLALSTSPTNDPTALHLGGCMVGALEELEDEGVSKLRRMAQGKLLRRR